MTHKEHKGIPEDIFIERPPVIAVMGHIDHGKSTLLDYIRKTNIVAKEAGGITQHISAYEVEHTSKEGIMKKITFLDTPGHEAFSAIRRRGATVADIAILVVSAEDGVKPQTLEAHQCIKNDGLPYIVAINKIDKPGANIEYTKQNLAEHEIYLEGYGGDIPFVAISAKTGTGIEELLDLMLLVAELAELKANPNIPAEGIVIESSLDNKKGISATLIVKNGTVKCGMYIASESSISPVRIMENFLGKPIKEASFSSPIRIIGWDSLPKVGSKFLTFDTKNQAIEYTSQFKSGAKQVESYNDESSEKEIVPIIIKADTSGSVEAIEFQITKATYDKSRIDIRVIAKSIGQITEADIKLIGGDKKGIVIGFNTKSDQKAEIIAERQGTVIKLFTIIYELSDWLENTLKDRTPRAEIEEVLGKAKILKTFSQTKEKQLVGGKVQSGLLSTGANIKIFRRENMLGFGKIVELQNQKMKVTEVREDNEFGTMIESKIEIAPGDIIEAFHNVEI